MAGAVLLVGGALQAADHLTLGGALACVLLLAAGTVAAYAARVLLACVAFWAPGAEPEMLWFAFWQLGRYPVSVYHRAVRWVLTYLVPVALVATVPAEALMNGADLPGLGATVAAAGGALWAATVVWKAGLARYTSATS